MPSEGGMGGEELVEDEMNFELLDMLVEEGNAAEYEDQRKIVIEQKTKEIENRVKELQEGK